MENTRNTITPRNTTLRPSKWGAGATALVLSASLILAACGGGSDPVVEEGGDTAPAVSTPAVEAETPEAEEAAEDAEATPTVDAEAEVDENAETEVITDTGVVTDTNVITEVVETEILTETTVITDTDVVTDVETEVITESEGMTETENMTGTEGTGSTGATTGAAGTATDTGAMMGVSGVQNNQFVRASTLLDYDFENRDGEVSGDLEDLLIDLESGRVLFANIEYGGVLDLGDKDIVVPLNAFMIGEEGELVLNIDEATLETYPDVGNDWPNLEDPTWDDEVNTWWTEAGIDVGAGFDEATTSVARASELVGINVGDQAGGAGAGNIQDILINLGTGRAEYAVVADAAGAGEEPYIIPMSAFNGANWQEGGLAYGEGFDPTWLENAPRYSAETYPDDTALGQDFGDQMQQQWNDLGWDTDFNNNGD